MKKRDGFWRQFLLRTVMVLVLVVLVFSLCQVIRCLKAKAESETLHTQMAELAVRPVPQSPPTEVVQTDLPELPQTPITVDLALLKAQNEDIVAWLYCPDTPIDHPVVQGEDNRYYLEHMVDGGQNPAGAIFLDCRSAAAMTDSYSVIYGHNLRDLTMFGSLPNYAEQAYYDAHPIMFLLTPEKGFAIELFAGFVTESDDGLYTLPITDLTRAELIENCMERSDFVPQRQPSADERLIVLSTCSYAFEDARYVLVGALREN